MNKRKVILGIILVTIFIIVIGSVSLFAEKESLLIQKVKNKGNIVADEHLSWAENLDWIYFQATEKEDDNIIGRFDLSVSLKNPRDAEAGHVILSCYDMERDTFFGDLQTHVNDLRAEYEEQDIQVYYVIDADAGIDVLARIDVWESEHWLYMYHNQKVYELHGQMNTTNWDEFVDALIVSARLEVDGQRVKDKEVAACHGTDESDIMNAIIAYRGARIQTYEEVRNVSLKNEFSVLLYDQLDQETLCVEIHELEKIPWYGNNLATVEALQQLYPEMNVYKSYAVEENEDGIPMLEIVENKCTHTYFSWQNRCYEMTCQAEKTTEEVQVWTREIQDEEGYDIFENFWWIKGENGLINWVDEETATSYTESDMGDGEIFDFKVECDLERGWQGELPVALFEVSIYRHGEEEAFQTITDVYSADRNPFELEDFNIDGYLDIRMMYYYGANGGSASRYIWSPSRQKFIYGPSELEYFGYYGFEPETRKLFMHYHASAVAGTENTYQWYNETDYKLIKSYSHMDEGEDYSDLRMEIVQYEGDKEIILSDYTYNMDEDSERISHVEDLYWFDFTWKQTIVNSEDGAQYILYYVQVPATIEEEEGYIELLYVCREDTYLLNWFVEEGTVAYTSVGWDDANGDGEEEFTVIYEDGSQRSILLSQILEEK